MILESFEFQSVQMPLSPAHEALLSSSQGSQGIRAAMGMMGSKGELVNVPLISKPLAAFIRQLLLK